MNKTWVVFLYLFCMSFMSLHLQAQAPIPSDSLAGEALRIWIKETYHTPYHQLIPFERGRLLAFDSIYNINDTVIDVYGGHSYYWPTALGSTNLDTLNQGLRLTYEHTIPRSYYRIDSNEFEEPMFSDMHHLFPALGKWNSTRSNYPFVEVPDHQTTKWMRGAYSQNTIPNNSIQNYSEYNKKRFEPREEHKGNCARAIFYFYTMYPPSIYTKISADIDSIANLQTLYRWHLADPPDSLERIRNQMIANFQGNKNPYIDHPEWVEKAWPVSLAPLTPFQTFQVSPSINEISLSWEKSEDVIFQYIYRSKNNQAYSLIQALSSDTSKFSQYIDRDVATDSTYAYYAIAVYETGMSSSTDTLKTQLLTNISQKDLFISEYVEGSGYNKVLEIANFTGKDLPLAPYSLQSQKNGKGYWETSEGDIFRFSDTLKNGQVYVIRKSAAKDSTVIMKADTTFGGEGLNFNGNDVVGLFRQDTLIDMIGYPGEDSYFAQDVTLIRKPHISGPNSSYLPSEWIIYPKDTFHFLGSHEVDFDPIFSDSVALEFQANIFPNPFQDRFQISLNLPASSTMHSLSVLIMDQSGLHLETLTPISSETNEDSIIQAFDSSRLSEGIYLLALQIGEWRKVYRVWKR